MDSLSYTFRRRFLDKSLETYQPAFEESVLEIGNGTIERREHYKPIDRWYFIDLSFQKKPSLIGNGELLPVKSNAVSTVLALEVLEHLADPCSLLKEIYRVLKPGSRLYLSMPFIIRFHPAACDFQRFTELKLRDLMNSVGFKILSFEYQGFYFTVLSEQIKSLLARISNKVIRQIIGLITMPFLWFLVFLDQTPWVRKSVFCRSYTTGFFIVCEKRRP